MTNSKRLSSTDVDTLSTEYSALNATKTASFEQLALGQKVSFQPERNDAKWYRKLFALPAYYWVLIAQFVVVLPHAAHLPLWLIGFAAVSIAAQLPHIKTKFKLQLTPLIMIVRGP